MDKKNTILLTVIAVATLLVAMVGATFAYFTAQRGKGAQADITVKTSTSDSLEMDSFTPISIVATQDNFGEKKGTRSGEAKGIIKLTANDATTTSEVSYCYTADLVVSKNEFTYSRLEGTEKGSQLENHDNKDPELVLALYKEVGLTSADAESTDEKEYKIQIGKDGNTLDYLTNIITTNVCSDNDTTVENTESPQEDSNCPQKTISGYDITTLASTADDLESPSPQNNTISIPLLDTANIEEDTLKYVHKITANRGETSIDRWRAVVYFINYGYDQQKNTGKEFNGILKFTTVNCDGSAIASPGEP